MLPRLSSVVRVVAVTALAFGALTLYLMYMRAPPMHRKLHVPESSLPMTDPDSHARASTTSMEERLRGSAATHLTCEDIPLCVAAHSADERKTKKLLAAGADVNQRDRDAQTPLHHAAYRGACRVTSLLLQAGAEVDPVCEDGRTPLHIAAWGGYIRVVEALVAAGADVAKASEKVGQTALHFSTHAGFGGHLEVSKFLLEAGAPVHARNKKNQTAMHYGRHGQDHIRHHLVVHAHKQPHPHGEEALEHCSPNCKVHHHLIDDPDWKEHIEVHKPHHQPHHTARVWHPNAHKDFAHRDHEGKLYEKEL